MYKKKCFIVDCRATVCGPPVYHRLELRTMQLPSQPGIAENATTVVLADLYKRVTVSDSLSSLMT